jgi:tRNA threonylcarbamoyladenosine biosynthesis protein TsaE
VRLPFLSVRSRSAAETTSLGRCIGTIVKPGEILLLVGDLGTGKTTFVQGLGEALELTTPARSPSYTLVHSHEGGKYPLVHVDLYRCDGPADVLGLGLEELIAPPAVSVVEWGEKAFEIAGADYLELDFSWDASADDTRNIKFLPSGRWRDRMSDLAAAVRGWATPESA